MRESSYPRPDVGEVARAAFRGMVAAMAMTGTRTVTAGIAPTEKSPPEEIVSRHAPRAVQQLPQQYRSAITELCHWTYGAVGGGVFGLLPEPVRRKTWIGPAYGMAIWVGWQAVIAPMLGAERSRERTLLWPTLVALDHVLYGLIVSGRLTR